MCSCLSEGGVKSFASYGVGSFINNPPEVLVKFLPFLFIRAAESPLISGKTTSRALIVSDLIKEVTCGCYTFLV